MLSLTKRISAGDGNEFSFVMLEMDPHTLYVCESKYFKKVVLKEFKLDEIKYNFKKHGKRKFKLIIVDLDNNKHNYIVNSSDRNRLFSYFKKNCVGMFYL